MPTRKITAQPPDVTILLFELGTRTVVLVEGDTDFEVFHEWYRDRQDRLMFQSAAGVENVQRLLGELLKRSTKKNVYGIIDRDFRSDEEVENSLSEPDSHLFILDLYSIENYLLLPNVAWEQLRTLEGPNFPIATADEMSDILLTLSASLHTMMAANWVFSEETTVQYFPYAHELTDRKTLVALAAKRLGCKQIDADRRIAEKESAIAPTLASIPEAYVYISGKHLLFQVHTKYVGQGFDQIRLTRLLAHAVKEKTGIPEHVGRIIEGRILDGSNALSA